MIKALDLELFQELIKTLILNNQVIQKIKKIY